MMRSLLTFGRAHAAKALIVLIFSIPTLAPQLPASMTAPLSAWLAERLPPPLLLLLQSTPVGENRNLAALPELPRTWAGTLAFPAALDSWVADHMGFRSQLITANNLLRFELFGQFPTSQALLGRHGRVFLASYGTNAPAYSGIDAVCGIIAPPEQRTSLVAHLNLFSTTMEAHGLDGHLMIVPSAPVVYTEDLPAWEARRCTNSTPPIATALASPQLRAPGSVLYPLAELRAMRADAAVYPGTWFHWAGPGARRSAELSLERFWHIAPDLAPPLKHSVRSMPSDLSHLFPGVALASAVDMVDTAASGVTECHGAPCYPELPEIIAKLWGVTRFSNPAAPLPRLVLVTDSFGLSVGPWYARYYRDVLQVTTNDLSQLTPAERARLAALLFQRQQPQHLLFIYHDATVQGGSRIAIDLAYLLPPQGAAGAVKTP